MNEIRKGIYRHFKGNKYEVLSVAKHSETLEEMVVYKALYGERGTWVRPASMWNEIVERDGKRQPRFEFLGEFRRMSRGEIESWYTGDFAKAFAENERKPLNDIFALIDAGRYELWGLFEPDAEAVGGAESTPTAYAALWKRAGIPLVLLDYLGVTESRRNGGIGANMLEILKAQGFPIVTESELPVHGDSAEENAIRERRMEFYRRNGFVPAYEMATCGMRWQAYLAGAEEYSLSDIMRWHKDLYGPERTDVVVPLGKDETPQMPYWMKGKES